MQQAIISLYVPSRARTKTQYGPPVLNTPSQLGTGPLSKARCSIVGLEGLYPGTPSGTIVEDTDTQEAPDDIRECLHGLMHTRLSMCMLGLPQGK